MAKDDGNTTVQFRELGVSGLRARRGVVEEEFLEELRGARGRRNFQKMSETDPTSGAVLFSIRQIVKSAVWHAETKGVSDLDKQAAEFLHSVLNDMSHSWASFICEVCSMFTYGWSYFEIVFKKRLGRKKDPKSKHNDGLIGIRKLAPRGQNTLDRWDLDETGGIQGMWQTQYPTSTKKFIPIEKALLFNTDSTKQNPEGRSILANAFSSFYYLSKLKPLEAIGVERDLAGLPTMRVPVELFTDSDKTAVYQACKDLVVNVRRDEQEGILLPFDSKNPDNYKFELLSTGGRRQFSTNEIINRYKIEIAQTVLADFISLGHDSVGSYALARTKRDIFELAILAWLDSIAGVINAHMVPRLFDVNPMFGGLDELPIARYSIAKVPTLEEIAKIITALARANVDLTSSPDTINQALTEAGLPIIKDPEGISTLADAVAEKQPVADDEEIEEG